MLEVIEKLLILQDRDRKISRTEKELANIGPEREALQSRNAGAQQHLETVRNQLLKLETDRKTLELEVEAKKQQIEKYSIQQFQTKKNEEYKALTHEIENCKARIIKLDDQQIEIMEQAEKLQKELAAATQAAREIQQVMDNQLAELASREESLKKQLEQLKADHHQLMDAVEESTRNKYLRLRRLKGDNTVVGIEHSVCGGCHMKLPVHEVVSCKAQREIVTCPNCGRILYCTPHMDLAVAD